jgi:type II secretory pathway predicted ATPase ExeA
MYKHYFGLKDHPFRLVPDPHYFFPASFHEMVSKCLLEGLIGTLPVAVVSGPAGVGKTLLLTRFMTQLGDAYPVILISNPKLHFEELLSFIQSEFNITTESDSVAARLSDLEAFGQHSSQIGKRPVILVDEADSISEETLKALSKLASPVAAGIPSFFMVLATRNDTSRYLRLLPESQDAVKAYALLSLLTDQVGPYVDLRLCQAGYVGESPFTPEAIACLAELSHGIPRLINRLCDAALLEASLSDQKLISPQMIDEVAQGMWLALGNDSPSSNPPLAKGTEAAFLPKIERFPAHLESLSQTDTSEESRKNDSPAGRRVEYVQLTPPPKEEKTLDLDNLLPTERIPKLVDADQNNKGLAALLQKLRISGKKPRTTMLTGIMVVLVTSGLYIWVLTPGKMSLSSAAEFTEMIKSATNRVRNLTTEKNGEFIEVVKNDTNKAALPSVEKDRDEAILETLAGNQRSETSLNQAVQGTVVSDTEPQKSSDQSSQNSQLIGLPTQVGQQQEQDTALSEVKLKENPGESSLNPEIAVLLAQAEQQIADFNFTTPKGNNAYETYTKVLKIAPNHPEVASGLQRIRNYYVSWGLEAESQQQLSLAATYYKRALNIFPDDFALRTALRRVQTQREKR